MNIDAIVEKCKINKLIPPDIIFNTENARKIETGFIRIPFEIDNKLINGYLYYKENKAFLSYATKISVPSHLNLGDIVSVLIFICLIPGVIIVFILSFVTWIPVLLFLLILVQNLDEPKCNARDFHSFYVFSIIVIFVAFPLIMISFLWAFSIYLVTMIFSIPFALFNVKRTLYSLQNLYSFLKRPGERSNPNQTVADNFSIRYGYGFNCFDVVCALTSYLYRQNWQDTLIAIPSMCCIIPLYKLVFANPFLRKLEIIHVNQWSEPLPIQKASSYLRTIVTTSIIPYNAKLFTEHWRFMGHYPLPPINRASETVVGTQMGTYGRMCLLTHSTHSYKFKKHKSLSQAKFPFVGVHLQWWNPWHQLTAYVEVNIRKNGIIEHPMWVLMDKTSSLSMSHLAGINEMFDDLFPVFNEYMEKTTSYNCTDMNV